MFDSLLVRVLTTLLNKMIGARNPSLVLAAQQGKNPKTLEANGKKPAVLAFAECRTRNASRRLCPPVSNIPIWNILFVARRSG